MNGILYRDHFVHPASVNQPGLNAGTTFSILFKSSVGSSRGSITDHRSTAVTFIGPNSRRVSRRGIFILVTAFTRSLRLINRDLVLVMDFVSVGLVMQIRKKTHHETQLINLDQQSTTVAGVLRNNEQTLLES